MVTTRLPTSKSSRPFNNHLVTLPNAPITIGIVRFMFQSFFYSFFTNVSLHFLSVKYCGQPVQLSPQFCKFFFFVDIIIILLYNYIMLYYIISFILFGEFFAPALADSYSLEYD